MPRKTLLRLFNFPVVLFAILVLTTISASAQTTGGTLRGEVKDIQGKLIPDVPVNVTNELTGVQHTTTASSVGLYSFPNLLIGSYTLTVEKDGFKRFTLKDITVSANQVTDANVTIEVGDITTYVEVVGGAELIPSTSSQIDATLERKEILDIPNPVPNGSPLNLALLLPNTTSQEGGLLGEGGAIGGNRPENNTFTLDGVENNYLINPRSMSPVIQDAVAELNLKSNQFDAEYGHSSAGHFNIVTKTGTNNYHGSAFYFSRNRHLNALDNLAKEAIESGDLSDKPRYDYNRLGGTLGGPIRKDKLFFFTAYEYSTRGEQANGVTVLGPTQAGMDTLEGLAANSAVRSLLSEFPVSSTASDSILVNSETIPIGNVLLFAPNYDNRNALQTNIDYNAGSHQIRGRFLYDRYRTLNQNPMLPQPQFTGDRVDDSLKFSLTDVWALSPTIVNDLRLSYSRYIEDYRVPDAYQDFPNIWIYDLGLNVGPNDIAPQKNVQNNYQLINNLSYVVGRHQLKGGFEYNRVILPSNFLPFLRGEWDYLSMEPFINDEVPIWAALGVGSSTFSGDRYSLHWFFQDDIKATENLTLNLGIRYEYTSNPRDAAMQSLNSLASVGGVFEFRNPKTDKNNFGPRVGFAYTPDPGDGFLGKIFGEQGDSVIRGGVGISYNVNFENLILLGLPPQYRDTVYWPGACSIANPPDYCNSGVDFLAEGGLPSNLNPPASAAEARAITDWLIVDQVSPRTSTWTLSIEREFAQKYVLELRYLGTQTRHLPVQKALNTITVFENHPGLALPTYFSDSSVPGTVSLSDPSLSDFYGAMDVRYSSEGFYDWVWAFPPEGSSIYHAGSVDLHRRFTSGFLMRANYTWSRTIDYSTNVLRSSYVNPRRPQDHYDLKNDRGLSALDIPHKFSLSWIYELPGFGSDSSFIKQGLEGWQVSGTFLAQSGQPITALSGQDANGDFDNAGDRALLNPNGSEMTGTGVNYVLRDSETGATTIASDYGSSSEVVGYVAINPDAKFVVAMPGTPDDNKRVGRNTIRSLGLNNWNLAVYKQFTVRQGKYFQFRVEFYNAFNHRQYSLGLPSYQQFLDNALSSTYANVSSPLFLDATQFSGGNRGIQMGLKFVF